MTAYQDDAPVLNWRQTTRTSRTLLVPVENPDGTAKDLTAAAGEFRVRRPGEAAAIELDAEITFDDPGGAGYPNRAIVPVPIAAWDGLAGSYNHELHITDAAGDRGLVLQGEVEVVTSVFED